MSGRGEMLSALAAQWGGALPSPLDRELARKRDAGETWIDLITANPHEHGLVFPGELLGEAMSEAMAATRVYRPDPLGPAVAREAIAEYYRRRGGTADAATIALTPGTSLGYFYALRMLLNRGEEVLIPSPGYPLFDDLCATAGIGLRKYHLRAGGGGWEIDVHEIDFQVTAQTRAVVVVSPHNPTGAMPATADWRALGEVCRRRNLALIVDEVFCETADETFARPMAEDFPLIVTLNGFSKMFSLPGWKIGWMKIDGERDRVARFMGGLEHLNDTFLPMPDLQQGMIAPLFRLGDPGVLADLRGKIAARRAFALARLREAGWEVDACRAGAYLCARLPEGTKDEAFALKALGERGVLVHPGYFYNLPAHWAITCIAGEVTLAEGIARLGGRDEGFA